MKKKNIRNNKRMKIESRREKRIFSTRGGEGETVMRINFNERRVMGDLKKMGQKKSRQKRMRRR